MDHNDKESSNIDVGLRLRILREERGVSMRALARRSGLSANALSMIERGITSPSVTTLNKLATALEVPITAFFRLDPPRNKVVFRKAKERVRAPFLHGVWESLGGEAFIGRIEAYALTLERGANSGRSGMLHTGHELVLCLSGKLEYEVDNALYLLEAGDSLIFAARLAHGWRNASDQPVEAVIVLAGFEESEHPGEFHVTTPLDEGELDEETNDLGLRVAK